MPTYLINEAKVSEIKRYTANVLFKTKAKILVLYKEFQQIQDLKTELLSISQQAHVATGNNKNSSKALRELDL